MFANCLLTNRRREVKSWPRREWEQLVRTCIHCITCASMESCRLENDVFMASKIDFVLGKAKLFPHQASRVSALAIYRPLRASHRICIESFLTSLPHKFPACNAMHRVATLLRPALARQAMAMAACSEPAAWGAVTASLPACLALQTRCYGSASTFRVQHIPPSESSYSSDYMELSYAAVHTPA